MGDSVEKWLRRYGPQQFRDVLGLTEWQYHRALAAGVISGPDLPGGKWSSAAVQGLHWKRAAIRFSAGSVPDVGAERAAGYLSDRLGIEVAPHALPELARNGLILIVDDYKGHPLYCGRTIETFTDREAIERANVAGELVTADTAADRLGIRPSDLKHLVQLGWLAPVDWARGPFTTKSRRPDVPLYRAGDLTALLGDSAIDWEAARSVNRGQRSPLAKLPDRRASADLAK